MTNSKEDPNDKKNEDDTNSMNTKKSRLMDERSEYFLKLEKWLQEAYAWQSVAAMFPHHILPGQTLNLPASAHPFNAPIANVSNSTATNNATPVTGMPDWQNNNEPVRQRMPQEPPQPPRAEGYEYRIPPMWKRFVAEIIDSMILLSIKMIITFCTGELFAFVNLEPYFQLDLAQSNIRFDYNTAFEFAWRVLIWEIVHRLRVCIFEAMFLQYGLNGTIGGASPGKLAMGLMVVHCRSVTPIERPDGNDMVFVSPGTDLGLPRALGRSLLKNFIMMFLFPICFVLFFFRFNRTGYDLACNSIVVEDPVRDGIVRYRPGARE